MIGAGLAVWVATTVIAVLLPVMYDSASEIIQQFDIMGRWLVTVAHSQFEYMVFTARANDVVSYANFPSELGVTGLGLPPWYRFNESWSQDVVGSLADEAEELHRCVVFGCAEEGVPGVSTSPKLEDYFFGPAGIDEGFKVYVQDLRLRAVEAPVYTSTAYMAMRNLPRLYASLFNDWAGQYVLTLAVGMGCVLAIVGASFLHYYLVFVRAFTAQTRRYRFMLGLLPDRLVTQLPLFTSYMVTTQWVEPSRGLEADASIILGDADDPGKV